MIYLIIYLIGCVITYILLAIHNDRYFYDKIKGFWILISWLFILAAIIEILIKFSLKINSYPSLKWIKKIINNLTKKFK